MKKRALFLMLTAVCVLFSTNLAHAAIYDVYPSGNSQPNSTDQQNLSTAVGQLSAGDTLYLHGGDYWPGLRSGSGWTDYNNNLYIDGKNGSPNNWITIAAYPGDHPVIHLGADSRLTGGIVFTNNCSYIRVTGLDLAGIGDGNGWPSAARCGSLGGGSHDMQFVGNSVHGFGGSGISANGSQDLIESNSVFSNCYRDPAGDSGIDVYEPVLRSTDNTHFASDNAEFGNPGNQYTLIIRNNTVYSNAMYVNEIINGADQGRPLDGNGIILDDFSHVQSGDGNPYNNGNGLRTLVANNVVDNNGGAGIWAFHSSHIDLFNNTCFHNARNVSSVDLGVGDTLAGDDYIYNNIVLADGSDDDKTGLGVVLGASAWADYNYFNFFDYNDDHDFLHAGQGSHNLVGNDPRFNNAAAGDFQIGPGSGSPCIGAGVVLWQINYDRDGKPRNSVYDIGAYQDPPNPPTNLKAAGAAGTKKITLTWSAGKYATGYKVYRATSSGGPYTLLATVSATSYANTGLTAGTTYYYKVASTDAESDSAKVGPASAKVQ